MPFVSPSLTHIRRTVWQITADCAEQTPLRQRTRMPEEEKKNWNERKIACKNEMANFYIFFSTMATTMMSSES